MKNLNISDKELINLAIEATKNAYTPYSHFKVGAALLCKDGEIYLGCNIENSSYGATNCAERTAFFKAISEGHREFLKIAIVGGTEGNIEDFCMPCGICRQVMAEFCDNNFKLLFTNKAGDIKILSLNDVLPNSFDKTML